MRDPRRIHQDRERAVVAGIAQIVAVKEDARGADDPAWRRGDQCDLPPLVNVVLRGTDNFTTLLEGLLSVKVTDLSTLTGFPLTRSVTYLPIR